MLKKGIIVENVTVGDYAAEAKCVSRIDDQVVFIDHVAPGDVIDLQIIRKKKSWLEARPVRFRSFSPFRTDPLCQYFGECGGCKWQHLQYDKQLMFKQQQIVDQLERIGGVRDLTYHQIIGSSDVYAYRNKLEFTFSNQRWLSADEIQSSEVLDRNGLGFHKPRMFDKVLDIHQCHLQPDLSNRIRNFVRKIALDNKIPFYDLRMHEGFLRNLIIRNSNQDEWMIILQVKQKQDEWIDLILGSIKTKFPEVTSMYYIINQKQNESYGDQDPILYAGKPHLTETMEDLVFQIGPKSFYQTNSKQSYQLYKIARDLASFNGDEIVYDLYTGTGTIANFIAGQVRKVVGIEYIDEAIEDAKKNALANNIANTEFVAGDIKDVLNDDFIDRFGKPDIIITDPPRAGMHKDVIASIMGLEPEKIVYISCNPATQARDVKLMDNQYRVVASQGVDMFPHTHHVENVVLLKRKDNG